MLWLTQITDTKYEQEDLIIRPAQAIDIIQPNSPNFVFIDASVTSAAMIEWALQRTRTTVWVNVSPLCSLPSKHTILSVTDVEYSSYICEISNMYHETDFSWFSQYDAHQHFNLHANLLVGYRNNVIQYSPLPNSKLVYLCGQDDSTIPMSTIFEQIDQLKSHLKCSISQFGLTAHPKSLAMVFYSNTNK